MKKITLLFLFFIFLNSARAEDYQWGAVTAGGISNELHVTGRIIPREGALSIESARIQGRIINILKREGEKISEKEPLFIINSPECLSLMEEKHIAQSHGLKDLVESAERREKQLGLKINGQCEILATHNGIMTKRQVEIGASFNLGDPLATIVNIDQLTVELDVPERDLSKVKPGQKVKVILASDPDSSFPTTIQHLLPTIDPTTRTTKARLSPLSLPSKISVDALVFAKIEIEGGEQILSVPPSALVFDHNTQYVIKKGNPQPSIIPVRVVSETDSVSSIRPVNLNDLKVGDPILIKGTIFMYDKLMKDKP